MDMNMMRKQLQDMSFPAGKQDLMNWAMQHGAGKEQMEMIKKMPMDRFESADDVMNAANMTKQMG
jgi:hypothetical protein